MLSPLELATQLGVRPPTEEQARVIGAPLEPALVIAGAGAGKTATMALRVAWLIATGHVAPGEVLGLTFTRKAAGELAERIHGYVARLEALGLIPQREDDAPEALPMPGADRPEVSTYNSYAAAIVRDYGILAGLDPEARLLGEASRHLLAEQVLDEAEDLPLDRLGRSRSALIDAVVTLSDACNEHLVDPDRLAEELGRLARPLHGLPSKRRGAAYTGEGPTNATGRTILAGLEGTQLLAPLVGRFADAKAALGVIDFGDQVAGAARLAAELPAVAIAERQRWRVVLLDEYQDTSYSQYTLLRRLFAGHPVTAVGDPRQSIYGWRGASAGNMRDFATGFPRADGRAAQVHQLTIGFRNDEAILRAANAIAGRLPSAGSEQPLMPRPDAGPGTVRIDFPPARSASQDAAASTVEAQYARLADWAADQRGQGRSCAVLCRTRGQFTGVEAALRSRGVPAHTVGTAGLLAMPEVQDIVAVLHALADPDAGTAAARLLTSERAGLGAADIAALHAWHRQRRRERERGRDAGPVVDHPSLLEALDDLRMGDEAPDGLSAEALARLRALAAALHRLRQRASGGLVDLIRAVIAEFLLDVELYADPLSPPQVARLHVDAFMQYAAEFEEAEPRATLGAFLAWLESARQRDRGLARGQVAPGTDAVLLMTVHTSKGLEFDAVAVPDCVSAKIPGTTSSRYGWLQPGQLPYPLRGDRAHLPEIELVQETWQELQKHAEQEYAAEVEEHRLAEERRLFYVAVTRAARSLWLGGSWWGAGTRPQKPSPFLLDLVEDLGIDAPGLHRPPAEDEEKPGTHREHLSWPPQDPAPAWLIAAAEDVDTAMRRRPQTGDLLDVLAELDALGAPEAREAAFLLRERQARELRREPLARSFPARISPTAMVRLHADRSRFEEDLVRPMPRPSSHAARVGTAFHAWIESRYGQAALYELDELTGAAEDRAGGHVGDAELAPLKDAFLASRFADLTPMVTELPFELSLGGVAVPGTIDAVFDHGPEAGAARYEVVDWKTGRMPAPDRLAVLRLQLAVYRLAFARWHGIDDLEQIAGTFAYLAEGKEVTYRDLPGEEELTTLIRGQ